MSLINCPECGKKVSNRAFNCPNCGYPISEKLNDENDNNDHIDFNEMPDDGDYEICSICGNKFYGNDCPHCENKVSEEEIIYETSKNSIPDHKCVKCGAYFSSKLNTCPNCHYKQGLLNLGKSKENAFEDNLFIKKPSNQNYHAYIALALVFASLFTICGMAELSLLFSVIAFIESIISFNEKYKQKTAVSVISLVTSIIIAIIATLIVLIATNSDNEDADTKTNIVTTETTTNVEDNTQDSETEATEVAEVIDATVIDEQIIYQDNGVIIKVMGCEENSFGLSVNINIENDSDKNLGFNAHSYAVNGVMTNDSIYAMDCDVAAGKKANTTLFINNEFLDKFQMNAVKSIDVLFWAYDNDAMFKEFETNQIEIRTNKYDAVKYQKAGKQLLNTDTMSLDYISNSGNTYYFVLTNKSDNYFDFDFSNISINDYTISDVDYDLYDVQLLSNCQILLELNIDDGFLSQNAINTVDKIDFNITYRPLGDYFNEKSTDLVTLSEF